MFYAVSPHSADRDNICPILTAATDVTILAPSSLRVHVSRAHTFNPSCSPTGNSLTVVTSVDNRGQAMGPILPIHEPEEVCMSRVLQENVGSLFPVSWDVSLSAHFATEECEVFAHELFVQKYNLIWKHPVLYSQLCICLAQLFALDLNTTFNN
jgi:hypothetical protein